MEGELARQRTPNRGPDQMYNSKIADVISNALGKTGDMALVIDVAPSVEIDFPIASVSAGHIQGKPRDNRMGWGLS